MPAVANVESSNETKRTYLRLAVALYLGAATAIFAGLFATHLSDLQRFSEHIWIFGPIGVFGAIIANSTGTGGGVVFVPFFNALSGASEMGNIPMEISIDTKSTIGISFLIQCFGMSVGSCVWIMRFFGTVRHESEKQEIAVQDFLSIIFTVLVATIPSLILTQHYVFSDVDGQQLLTYFKIFSLILGVSLLVFTWAYKRVRATRTRPTRVDHFALLGIGLVGGFITALFSVGVGELLAVYLIWRQYPTVVAVAIAVVVSAITVISGVGFHIHEGNIVWPVALAAIPGAVIGGFLARIFATWLGALWLKTFAALWIALSSAFLLLGPLVGALP